MTKRKGDCPLCGMEMPGNVAVDYVEFIRIYYKEKDVI
jgi:hypothetical protein